MVSRIERLEKQYKDNMEKANNAKSAIDKLRKEHIRKEKIALRKARNNALFKVGGLVELAGLLECDKGALLGSLLAVAETLNAGPDASRFQQWKQSGDALLAQREAERKSTIPKTAETEIPV